MSSFCRHAVHSKCCERGGKFVHVCVVKHNKNHISRDEGKPLANCVFHCYCFNLNFTLCVFLSYLYSKRLFTGADGIISAQ